MMRKGLSYPYLLTLGCSWIAIILFFIQSALAAEDKADSSEDDMALVRAVMCEFIDAFAPQNQAVVFSIDVGKISCFTSFDRIESSTFTRHKWFRRDELVTTKRLTLHPPSWSTYSSIQLREADKGPWRVEILNHRNQLIKTLRFSVTD
ncbi:MAG: DUF2914 domain-containing protein [Desulfobacteraceae bacterium]|jgi:hypothetical protein